MTPLLLMLLALPAMEDFAKVRTTLVTKGDIYVGQKVTVVIDLLVPTFFAGAPSFDVPDVPGTVILPPGNTAPVLGNEKIGDVTYTTQRHELTIYPQRAGTVTIPSFGIRVVASAGPGKPPTTYPLKTEAITFDALMPKGVEGLSTILSAESVEVKEDWHPEKKDWHVGDALTRTITITVPDVPGMVIPAIHWPQIKGLKGYPRQPVIADHSDRGTLTGSRIESITYVAEQPGAATLPAMQLTWWNLKEKKLERISLPARELTVSTRGAEPATNLTTKTNTRSRYILAIGCILVALLTIAGWLYRQPIINAWRRHKTHSESSEHAQFARFQRASKNGNLHAIEDALRVWLSSLSEPMTIPTVMASSNDFSTLVQSLQQQLYGHKPDSQDHVLFGRQLIQAAAEWRKTQRAKRSLSQLDEALHALNP